jgi:thiamine biosynthesis lipoprotein
MNRRDFLHPRRLAYEAGQVAALLDGLPVQEPPTSEAALLRLSRRAMACTFELMLPFGSPLALDPAAEAFDLLDALEEQLSVYRPTSEVSRLNQQAFDADVVAEEGLFALLQCCQQLTAATAGAFDVSTGALIKAWGFFRGPRRVPAEGELALARAQVGMQWVRLDTATRSVRLLRRGLEINLGSIGKGYALDCMAKALEAWQARPSLLLHGGHSSVCARGFQPGDDRGWPVGIRHPWVPGRRLATVWLRDRALGTSAATYQHLVYQGRKADALATAFFILGVDAARQYCAAHPEIGAVLLPQRPAGPAVVLGLGSDECDLVSPSARRPPSRLAAPQA